LGECEFFSKLLIVKTPQAMCDAIGAYGKSFNFVLITLSQPLQQWLPLV